MDEDLDIDINGDDLIQPSKPVFGPKPQQILELEERLDITLYEEKFISLDEFDDFVEESMFSRDSLGEIISLKLSLQEIDFKDLDQFDKLAQLSIENSIVTNLQEIRHLKLLKALSFYMVQTDDLDYLSNSNNLEYLLLVSSNVKTLDFLNSLTKLRVLNVGGNDLYEIAAIKYVNNLVNLLLWDNYIKDIEPIRELRHLEEVDLRNNFINDISALSFLPNLSTIAVNENNISDIPVKVLSGKVILRAAQTKSKNSITLEKNPLTSPPWSVIDLGMPAVHAYFDNKEKHGARPLNEGRIIFVGDGSAGKTSLMNRIIYNQFDNNEKQTNGIKIEQWHLQKDNRDLQFNLWDFGGQEIQHAIHKFFFTSGCLYILVLDNRKEEEPEYWLQQIETLGDKAPVLVVFNKTDQNPVENVDRKFLKEKYPNIVGFFNLSCLTGAGIPEFQKVLEEQAPLLSTVNDQFPGNWFAIKKELEASTSNESHYVVYDSYIEICKKNGVVDEDSQKLLLQYFSFIGTVTWFGDNNTYLEHMHVLNPAWITQGVYRIVTGVKTQALKGQIHISDFKELLYPVNKSDYVYNESHHGYILALMKKFELCYTANDKDILIPSLFSKEPKIEYKDFIGEGVRTYVFQFTDYLPVAVIHQFIVRNIEKAFDKNYWYQGIVIQNKDKDTLAMVQLDKEAKRIYVRVKGAHVIGLWEYIREVLHSICGHYANLNYSEQVQLQGSPSEALVQYEDLISHIRARKSVYFHPKLQRDFNVGYLMGMFESKAYTLAKVKEGRILLDERERRPNEPPPYVINILNNISPTVTTQVNTQVSVEINIQLVHRLALDIKDDANYLLEEIKENNKALSDALQTAIRFADEMGKVKSTEEAQGKGWGRRIKQVIEPIKFSLEFLKTIPEGYEAGHKIIQSITELAQHLLFKIPGV
jgi:small GTP-binding protein